MNYYITHLGSDLIVWILHKAEEIWWLGQRGWASGWIHLIISDFPVLRSAAAWQNSSDGPSRSLMLAVVQECSSFNYYSW